MIEDVAQTSVKIITAVIEVRDFPARDIWSLGVILPGLDQIPRVLGTSPPPPPPSPPSVGPKWSKYEQK